MQSETARKFFELFLRFNRRLTFIVARLSPPLSLNESHVLGEIRRGHSVTAGDICRRLVLEKSIASRLLASLEERGFLASRPSATDRRVKHLCLTAAGERIFARDNELRNRQVQQTLAELSEREQTQLASYLRRMAESVKASEIMPEPDDPPAKNEIRRLTRALGFLGDDLLGTGLSVQKCQVLSLLAASPEGASMASLKEELPYETSMLSRLVSAFQSQRLVSKSAPVYDRRFVHLRLTAGGYSRHTRMLQAGSARISRILGRESADSLREFTNLLEKFLSGNRLFNGIHVPGGSEIVQLRREHMLREARRFLVEELVRSNRHHLLSEHLLARGSLCFGRYESGELTAVAEFRNVRGAWRLLNFAGSGLQDRSQLVLSFLAPVLRTVFSRPGVDKIEVLPTAGLDLEKYRQRNSGGLAAVLLNVESLRQMEEDLAGR